MVVAVAGDVKAAQVMPVLEKYFDRLPASHKPDETTTTEPPQNSERKVTLMEQSQPLYLEGYHRPDYKSKDDAVYDAITDLMSEGRTSRLYRALVRDKKIASFSAGFGGLPGTNIRICSPSTRSRSLGTLHRKWPTPSMSRSIG